MHLKLLNYQHLMCKEECLKDDLNTRDAWYLKDKQCDLPCGISNHLFHIIQGKDEPSRNTQDDLYNHIVNII